MAKKKYKGTSAGNNCIILYRVDTPPLYMYPILGMFHNISGFYDKLPRWCNCYFIRLEWGRSWSLIKNWMHSFEVSLGVWKRWPKYIFNEALALHVENVVRSTVWKRWPKYIFNEALALHVENVVRSTLSYPNETSKECIQFL